MAESIGSLWIEGVGPVNLLTKSQRRFVVVEVPVLSIVRESWLMPFRYLQALVKFGWIPFAGSLAVRFVCFLLLREDVSRGVTSILMGITHFILFTPFTVTWTKLAIQGRQAVEKRRAFAYTRTEWMYLLATVVMITAFLVLVISPLLLGLQGQRNFEHQIEFLGIGGSVLGLGVFVVGYVRLAFVFPAIAIGRYAGIRVAWRQTAGNLERLAAIILLSYLPYYLIRQAFFWWMGYHPPGVAATMGACVDMVPIVLATTALAGPALAYKSLAMEGHKEATT